MKVIRSIAEFKNVRNTEYFGKAVGFVPTMGALHEGHASLVKLAKSQNQISTVSIFVNPTQFSATEDFSVYPRVEDKDLSLLESLGVDSVFCPHAGEIYPHCHSTSVIVKSIQDTLEGKSRPTHFPGVATIVTKLFNIIQPTRAYFGKKDATQTVLINRLVEDLNIPVEIVLGDTLREPNGLAMSSRNQYLTKEYRERASIIYESLRKGEELVTKLFSSSLDHPIMTSDVVKTISENIKKEPELELTYVSVESCRTGLPLEYLTRADDGAILSIACRFGGVRLIDNIRLNLL